MTQKQSERVSKNSLEAFENPRPERDFVIRIRIPEFTCLCPKTGQPDFAELHLEYIADRSCVELKSLKYYLLEFRNEGSETMRVGSVAQATFSSTSREALTPARVPSESDAWFMPFDVPAHGTARKALLFEGTEDPELNELEARRSAPSADPLAWCTLRATGLASQ